MGFCRLLVALTISAFMLSSQQAAAQQANSSQYTVQEIVDAGHSFFGSTSGGLAKVIEAAFQKYGLPNGYILGQEGSGAFIAGFGMTLLKNNNVLVVPIRTGVGARLGVNVGYLKITPGPTWNPF